MHHVMARRSRSEEVGLRTATGTTPASVPEQLPMTRSAGRSGGGGHHRVRDGDSFSASGASFTLLIYQITSKCGAAPHQNHLYKIVVVEKKKDHIKLW